MWRAQRLPPSAAVVHTATGEQAEPTSSVGISVERGKPVAFLNSGKARRKTCRWGLRVEEEGTSEGREVITRIGIASTIIIPRASGLTSLWPFITRKPGQPFQEAKQMTAEEFPAGAASREEDWHAIDWQTVHRKRAPAPGAYREGNSRRPMGQGESPAASADPLVQRQGSAVRRVTENQGHRTSGVDGVVWNTPQRKQRRQEQFRRRGYQPQPLRRVYIPKRTGKTRL